MSAAASWPFVLNSTVGIEGTSNGRASIGAGAQRSGHGITLGLLRVRHGAYLVLPLLPPTTVRDGLGTVADSLMNPLGYFTPYYVPLAVRVADTVNSRALNIKTFEALALSIDPYGAARNAYLQVRQQKLRATRTSGP